MLLMYASTARKVPKKKNPVGIMCGVLNLSGYFSTIVFCGLNGGNCRCRRSFHINLQDNQKLQKFYSLYDFIFLQPLGVR